MNNSIKGLGIAILLLSGCNPKKVNNPPLAPIQDYKETLFGMEINDPYRYMENLEDTVVLDWFKAQANHTRSILDNLSGRSELLDKMREFDGRVSARIRQVQITENDKYFYLKETPDDNH